MRLPEMIVSSFFRKGKEKCWNTLKDSGKFEEPLKILGNSEILSDHLFTLLQKFFCRLYGYNEKNIDVVRFKVFQIKHSRQKKIPDLASLPPCQLVLCYHSMKAIAVAFIWK